MSTLTLAATSYPFSNRQLTCLASLASSSSTSTSSTSTIPLIPAGLIYLPPLLSLLPSTSIPKTKPTQEFDFNNPSVGFTTSHLPSIDSASIALHNALHHFRPVSEDYAFVEYANAFNWDELRLEIDVEREWSAHSLLFDMPYLDTETSRIINRYIVAFRSTRDLSSSTQDLYEADRAAHEEAVSAGGLLAYVSTSPLHLILSQCGRPNNIKSLMRSGSAYPKMDPTSQRAFGCLEPMRFVRPREINMSKL